MEGDVGEVTLDGVAVPRVEKFKYLSLVEERRDNNEDISHRIRVG